MNPEKQIILYEYQKTRNASHPRKFLKDYAGICVTDGYQVHHTLEKEKEDLRIAGCWVHCRRKFHEALEVMPKELRKQSVLHLIMNQIQAIYRGGRQTTGLSTEERLTQRQLVVKPLVDALFAYLKQNAERVPKVENKRSLYLCPESGTLPGEFSLKTVMFQWIITPVNMPSVDSVSSKELGNNGARSMEPPALRGHLQYIETAKANRVETQGVFPNFC